MATRPLFKFTGFVNLPVKRAEQGFWEDGDWVDGVFTEILVKSNVQPLKPHEIMTLPESERSRDWLKVYSAERLRAAQEGASGWDADEFEWNGYTYRIMKEYNFQMGVLDHWKAWAARTPVTPNKRNA